MNDNVKLIIDDLEKKAPKWCKVVVLCGEDGG